MYRRNYKRILKERFKAKKYVSMTKNSMRFNHFLLNYEAICAFVLFCRLISIDFFMIGMRGGDYAYTRKLYNFIIFKNKRRR